MLGFHLWDLFIVLFVMLFMLVFIIGGIVLVVHVLLRPKPTVVMLQPPYQPPQHLPEPGALPYQQPEPYGVEQPMPGQYQQPGQYHSQPRPFGQ